MPIIYKYTIEITDKQIISLPGLTGYSSLLHFEFQGGKLCLWALVDPTQELASIEISIFGTGQEIDSELLSTKKHFTTVFDPRGFVWHIFVPFV